MRSYLGLIHGIYEVLKEKLAWQVRRKSINSFYWGGSKVKLILVITPSFCLKDTFINYYVVSILTSTLSFKNPWWSKTKVLLPFRYTKAQCLEAPWFSLMITTLLCIGNFKIKYCMIITLFIMCKRGLSIMVLEVKTMFIHKFLMNVKTSKVSAYCDWDLQDTLH